MNQQLLSNQVGDGSVSLSGEPLERSKTGGWKAAPFIYVLIFADTISVLGIAGNLATYASGTLHLSIAESANTVTNFMGFVFLLPVIGGFLADACFLRFWIIAFSCVATLMGLMVLTISASLKSLQPPDCTTSTDCSPSKYVLMWFYTAQALIAVGSAGTKPCMLSMGQDQFDETDPEEKKQGSNFFTGYYVFLNIYSIFCVTILFSIQSEVSFRWGYGTIAVLYLVSVSTFFLGTRVFRHKKPAGSPFTRVAQVFVAAMKNWNKPLPQDPRDLYELDNSKSSMEGMHTDKVVHTNSLRCLDKAAIIKSEPANGWEMCTVTQVEELKTIIHILPIWLCIVLIFTLYAQVMGIGVQQAATLDRRLSPNFTIAPGTAAVVLMLSGLAFLAAYQYLLLPPLRKITGHREGLSPLRKIGLALVIAILAMITAALVEEKRVQAFNEHPQATTVPMSVFWLVPQFALLGWVEVLLGVAQLHLLYRETPQNMRSLAVALTFTTISCGYFFSSLLVSAVNHFSAGSGGWLADGFNSGGLRKYYYLLSGIMGLDLLIFLVFAHFFTYKTIQRETLDDYTIVYDVADIPSE